MSETPEQSYYVGAKVRLAVRFDEYALDTLRKTIQPGTKDTKNIRGNPAPRGKLRVVTDPTAPPGVIRYELTDGDGSTAQQTGGGATRASSPDDLTFYIEGVIPHSISLGRNGFRKPDTCKVDMRYIDFPFDPRVIRAVAVDVYMGTVTPEEWAAGIAGATRDEPTGAVVPMNIIRDTWLDKRNNQQRTNLRFEGWADAYEMDWSKEGDQLVSLECSDSTHLLTLLDVPTQGTVDKTKPIDQAIAEYLTQFPSCQGLIVEYRSKSPRDENTPPRLGKVLSGTSWQPHLGPAPAKGGGAQGGDNLNIWEYITDIVGAIGHTVRVEGRTIIIQRLRDILDGKAEQRSDDPYRTRNLTSRRYENRAMIYGRNVLDLKLRREFAKKVPTNIEVRCFPGDTIVQAKDIEKAYRRWYSGPTVKCTSRGRSILTGTPNHPVLTERGWIAMSELVKGDKLIGCTFLQGVGIGDPQEDGLPTTFRELFGSLQKSGHTDRRSTRNVDFHGDGMEGEVEIVLPHGELRDRKESSLSKHLSDLCFMATRHAFRSFKRTCAGLGRTVDLFAGSFDTAACSVGGGRVPFPFGVGHVAPTVGAGLFEVPEADPIPSEDSLNRCRRDPDFLCKLNDRDSLAVTTHEVLELERGWFDGHVYNLQTREGWYIANGIVSHNCYNPRRKTVLVARFPEDGDKFAVIARPGADSNEKKWTVIPVAGIEDQKTLKFIAEDVYNALGRNEISVDLTTDNLGSFGGGNDDPDLLDMIPGDTVEVLVNHDEDFNSNTELNTKIAVFERNREVMKKLGYTDELSGAYAKAFTDANFQRLFRVKEVNLDWATDDNGGISVHMLLANYIEARADHPAADGPKPVTSSALAKNDAVRKAAGASEFEKKFNGTGTTEIAPGVHVIKK